MEKRITVIGDVMLDKYDYCRNRDNPESSAPCYTVERTEYKPGGAGNVAANLTKLGSAVDLISVIGEDPDAVALMKVLNNCAISHRLIHDSRRQTIVKERTMSLSDGRYHYRKDRETKEYIDENHVSEILRGIKKYGLIVISDYNKGVISRDLLSKLKETGIPIIVDPKPNHRDFYSGVYMITPNIKEAREMAGLENEVDAAEKLRDTLNTRVLLTRSQDGVSYFGFTEEPESYFEFPTEAKKVFDVTGAGDTVIATFAHFLNKGSSKKEAVRLANKAAGIAVSYPGCYQVSEEEIFKA